MFWLLQRSLHNSRGTASGGACAGVGVTVPVCWCGHVGVSAQVCGCV